MPKMIDFGDVLERGPAEFRLPVMTRAEFYDFCQRNPGLRAERDPDGIIHLMSPTESWTDSRNSELLADLVLWNRTLPVSGIAFGPSAGFTLPNSAERSPDASWVSWAFWDALTLDQRTGFAELCPEFVVELMSPSDRLTEAQAKMEEYRANGARLGWLIDRKARRVYVYRPGRDVETLDDPAEVSADPELPGFVLRMDRVF